MILRLTSRSHQRVYSYAIRSGIWSVVILEKSWKIHFLDPPKHHENMLKMHDLYKENEEFRITSRTKLARSLKQKNDSPRTGTHRVVLKKYLQRLGWNWTPTMFVGQGCKVHLKKDELPSGTLIVSCSKHITVVKNGVLHDTYDCSRNGTRCVYGYWTKHCLD